MIEYRFADYFQNHASKMRIVEKAMLFDLLLRNGEMSRKNLQSVIRCRPNNITEYVQDLMEENLVVESSTVVTGKGRPEVMLKIVPDRFVAISIWLDSRKLKGAFVDLLGHMSENCVMEIPADTDNTAFFEIVVRFIYNMVRTIPKRQRLIGIGFSLPGAVLANSFRWSFNSHLAKVRNLDLSRLSQKFNVPVRLFRLLDAQLLAMVRQNSLMADSTNLLIHWGGGVGASIYHNGNIMRSVSGGSCEIGHLKMDRSPLARPCQCGEKGCLETFASGWALVPLLQDVLTSSQDEDELGKAIASVDVSGKASVERAIEEMTSAIDSVFRTCFPERITIYGPFLKNSYIRTRFLDLLGKKIPSYAMSDLCIEVFDDDLDEMTAVGSTSDFFFDEIKHCLELGRI